MEQGTSCKLRLFWANIYIYIKKNSALNHVKLLKMIYFTFCHKQIQKLPQLNVLA